MLSLFQYSTMYFIIIICMIKLKLFHTHSLFCYTWITKLCLIINRKEWWCSGSWSWLAEQGVQDSFPSQDMAEILLKGLKPKNNQQSYNWWKPECLYGTIVLLSSEVLMTEHLYYMAYNTIVTRPFQLYHVDMRLKPNLVILKFGNIFCSIHWKYKFGTLNLVTKMLWSYSR